MTLTWTADFGDNVTRSWNATYLLCELAEVFTKAQRTALKNGKTVTFTSTHVTYSVKA